MDTHNITGELYTFFPTVIAAKPLGLDEDVRDEIIKFIRENEDRFLKRKRDGVLFEESPINLHHKPLMEPMFDQIMKAVQGALKGMGIDPGHLNLQITRSWANLNTQSMVTNAHKHVNSHISIVYYPDDSCAQAPINFLSTPGQNDWVPGLTDPAYTKLGVWDQKNFYTTNHVSYTPQPDLCIIFPSNIPHSVSANDNERGRISIAMDTLFTLKEYIFDEPLLPPPSDWKQYEL